MGRSKIILGAGVSITIVAAALFAFSAPPTMDAEVTVYRSPT